MKWLAAVGSAGDGPGVRLRKSGKEEPRN